MKRTLTCPRCQGGRIWNVRTMREHGKRNHPEPLRLAHETLPAPSGATRIEGRGKLETLVCAGCGYTEWYARELDPGPVAGIGDPAPGAPCGLCAGATWRPIDSFRERAASGVVFALHVVRTQGVFDPQRLIGGFSCRICCQCAVMQWIATGMADVRAAGMAEARTAAAACAGCGSRDRLRVATVREAGAYSSPLHLTLAPSVGRLAVEICGQCSAVEWYARDFGKLVHDPAKGVLLHERRAPAGSPAR